MNQETISIQSSQSAETKGYFDMADKIERNYSFDQRIVLKLVSENSDIFFITQEVPYNISQIMNKTYLIENQPIIGAGSFGTVFICWHMIAKFYCAVKVHQRCQAEEILQQVNEYKIQKLLNQKFSNSFLVLTDRVYIIQESINYFTTYAGMEIALATLSEYTANVDIQYDEFLNIYHSILKQILEMHSLRIAHRDIKQANIMYTHQKGWMLTDFGCAKFYQNQKEKHIIQGTKQYLPPNLRGLLKNNFQQIECEQNLFDNDIYAFLLTMLQIYKKGSSILQLQQMLDNESKLKQLPLEFQIHGKSYNYIKLNVLIGLNKIPLQKQFEQQQFKQSHNRLEESLSNSDYLIELIIKQKKLYKISGSQIWSSYHISLTQQQKRLSSFVYNSKATDEVNRTLLKYDLLLQDQFQIVEDKSLLEIKPNMKQWQYSLIYMYYVRLGNVQQLLNACLEIQKHSQETYINYKLSEIECLIELNRFEEALQILKDVANEQYLLDDMSYVRLEFYRIFLEKSWLESAAEISKFYKILSQYQISFLILRIAYNFTWIIHQYDINLDYYKPQDADSSFESIILYFGITTADPKEIIRQLEQRGADKFGIKQILFGIIQNIRHFSIFQGQFQVEEYFEAAIQFDQQHNPLQDWEIYYCYSSYCLKKEQFQKALSLINIAMQLVDKENELYVLQVLFLQMMCEINLDQCTQYQNTIMHVLMIVNKIQSSQCRLYIIKRLIKMLYLIFMRQQYLNQISMIIQQYLKFETNTDILFILNKMEWETVLTYKHSQSLISLFNSKMLSICENTNKNDIDMLRCFQNIAIILRQQVNVDKSPEIQTLAVNQGAKFIQNMIIFEDLFEFNQTETLNIENEIARLATLNNKFNQKKKMKESLELLEAYTFWNYKIFA